MLVVCGGVGVWVFSVAGDVYVMCVSILGWVCDVCVVVCLYVYVLYGCILG